ncbi:MAG: hypothetical protein R3F56_24130 [Planctomycetota bacterium]
MKNPFLLLTCCLASAAAAQFTSPSGYLTTEGSSNHDYILFKYTDLTWQQLDETSVGQSPFTIQRISWRRDAVAGLDTTWFARTIDIGVYLADSVLPGAISENYSANYKAPPVNVFVSRAVSLPDWTNPAVSSPAPWDFVIPLDQPWVYLGVDPFLWELRVTNNASASDYGNDFQSVSGSTGLSTSGTVIGTGCVATGQSAAMSLAATFKNQYVRFRTAFNVTRAPVTSPAYLFIDSAQSNIMLPGLCGAVYALPTVQVPLGVSDASGTVPEFDLHLPFAASTVGLTLYSQAAAVDIGQAGLPLALSNGRSNTFPNATTTPAPVTRVYGYRLATGSMRAPSVWTGGIVTRFD